MSLLTELAMWFGFGVVASIVVPIALALLLPTSLADRLADFAWGLVMSAIGQGLIVFRETTGQPQLMKYSKNSYLGSLTLRLGGETKHWIDLTGLMGRFHGRPLGLVSEDGYIVTDPRIAEIGELLQEAHASDRGVVSTDNGITNYVLGYVPFHDEPRGVDIQQTRRAVGGDTSAAVVELIKQWTENGQSQFDSLGNTVDYFIWLTALGMGFGMMYLAQTVADTSVSTPTNPLPAVMGVIPI